MFFFPAFLALPFFSPGERHENLAEQLVVVVVVFFLLFFFLDSGFECVKADFTSYFKHETSPWPQICQVC